MASDHIGNILQEYNDEEGKPCCCQKLLDPRGPRDLEKGTASKTEKRQDYDGRVPSGPTARTCCQRHPYK